MCRSACRPISFPRAAKRGSRPGFLFEPLLLHSTEYVRYIPGRRWGPIFLAHGGPCKMLLANDWFPLISHAALPFPPPPFQGSPMHCRMRRLCYCVSEPLGLIAARQSPHSPPVEKLWTYHVSYSTVCHSQIINITSTAYPCGEDSQYLILLVSTRLFCPLLHDTLPFT